MTFKIWPHDTRNKGKGMNSALSPDWSDLSYAQMWLAVWPRVVWLPNETKFSCCDLSHEILPIRLTDLLFAIMSYSIDESSTTKWTNNIYVTIFPVYKARLRDGGKYKLKLLHDIRPAKKERVSMAVKVQTPENCQCAVLDGGCSYKICV